MAAGPAPIPPCDVWYATLPHDGGNTTSGPRPCIVVADIPEARSTLVIPLTTTLDRERFAFTYRVQPSDTNGLRETSVALVFHVRHIDRKFLTNRAGNLSELDADIVRALLADLLGLKT